MHNVPTKPKTRNVRKFVIFTVCHLRTMRGTCAFLTLDTCGFMKMLTSHHTHTNACKDVFISIALFHRILHATCIYILQPQTGKMQNNAVVSCYICVLCILNNVWRMQENGFILCAVLPVFSFNRVHAFSWNFHLGF